MPAAVPVPGTCLGGGCLIANLFSPYGAPGHRGGVFVHPDRRPADRPVPQSPGHGPLPVVCNMVLVGAVLAMRRQAPPPSGRPAGSTPLTVGLGRHRLPGAGGLCWEGSCRKIFYFGTGLRHDFSFCNKINAGARLMPGPSDHYEPARAIRRRSWLTENRGVVH